MDLEFGPSILSKRDVLLNSRNQHSLEMEVMPPDMKFMPHQSSHRFLIKLRHYGIDQLYLCKIP